MSEKILLQGIVGSHLHGLNTPQSDVDITIVYVKPTIELFSIYHDKRESWTEQVGSEERYYTELRHFCHEALKCNPKAIELIFSNPYVDNDFGKLLLQNRNAFLSQRIKKSYTGILNSLLKRYNIAPTNKLKRNIIYLYLKGREVYTTGEYTLQVDSDFWKIFNSITDEELNNLVQYLDETKGTVLPEIPDINTIQEIVNEIRLSEINE